MRLSEIRKTELMIKRTIHLLKRKEGKTITVKVVVLLILNLVAFETMFALDIG